MAFEATSQYVLLAQAVAWSLETKMSQVAKLHLLCSFLRHSIQGVGGKAAPLQLQLMVPFLCLQWQTAINELQWRLIKKKQSLSNQTQSIREDNATNDSLGPIFLYRPASVNKIHRCTGIDRCSGNVCGPGGNIERRELPAVSSMDRQSS